MATLQTRYLLRACGARALLRHVSHRTSLKNALTLENGKAESKQIRKLSMAARAKAKRQTASDFGSDDGPASHASDRVSRSAFHSSLQSCNRCDRYGFEVCKS